MFVAGTSFNSQNVLPEGRIKLSKKVLQTFAECSLLSLCNIVGMFYGINSNNNVFPQQRSQNILRTLQYVLPLSTYYFPGVFYKITFCLLRPLANIF